MRGCRTAIVAPAVTILAAMLSACGSGSAGSGTAASSSSAARIPPPLDVCPATTTPWRALGGVSVDAAAVGSGPAVIFADDSGNNACGWLALAGRLVSGKHRVAVFSYTNPSATVDPENLRDLLAVATAAAKGGKFVLIGASLGGRLVIEAAAERPAGLAGIVSLSGEATLPAGRDITPDARRVTLPALYVGARADNYTEGTRQQDALHQAMRGNPNELLQRPGAAHGTTLLAGVDGSVVVPRVLTFVAQLVH